MKKMILLINSFFLLNCSGIHRVYENNNLDLNNKSTQYVVEKFDAKENNKSILFFTSGFEGVNIKIVNGKNEILEEDIETVHQIGFATLKTINNDFPVDVFISSNQEKLITLKKEDLKKNKFIYISKNIEKKNNYKVEYSNSVKSFF